MKNKLLLCAVALIGLVGCQKDVDVIGTTDKLANKTMLGCYTYTVVDSATMTTFKKECFLKKDASGNQIGYYRECTAGQGTFADVKKDFKWEALMAVDKLSMSLTVTFEDGSQKSFVWADGILTANNEDYSKSISGTSDVDLQQSIYADLQNTEFAAEALTYHEHLDTVPYLAWSTSVKFYAPEDTAAAKLQYEEELKPFIDTIVWYLRTMVPTHTLGYAHLDTIFGENDTTFTVSGMVYVDPKASTKGKNKDKHGITYLTSKIEKRIDQVNDRPASLVSSTMAFKRVNDVNTAIYTYELKEWSKEYYIDPADPAATTHDSICTFTASSWMIPAYTNALKFEVLLFGQEQLVEKKTVSGAETLNTDVTKENVHKTLSISAFSIKKGEATQADLKYKLKQ